MKNKKHFNIYDHLGTLQQTYINTGFNLTPSSMQTQKPFGGDNWSNSTLTTKESTLLNWIGKEKDNESNLGDHGVRKYEYETGRFISIDPLWANYYGWTPYQYSGNDPINKVDPHGKAVIDAHIMMDNLGRRLAGAPEFGIVGDIIDQIWIEVYEGVGVYYNEFSHLDNMSNDEIRPILKSGDYKNLTTHQTQDFYFHSNYIELMVQKGYQLGSIPVFNQLIPETDLYNYILDNIMTANYPSKSKSDIHSHDEIKDVNDQTIDFKNTGAFSAKDHSSHPYHDEAFRLGTIGTAYIFTYRAEIERINQRQRDNDRSGKESPYGK